MNEEDFTKKRKEYLDKYFTEYGVKVLENRLKSLVYLHYKKPNYPLKVRLYGFPELNIKNVEHHEGMIQNLKDILYIIDINLEVEKNGK